MKIGYLITARLKSTRLKKKIILPLGNQTILDQVINRCKAVSGKDGVVLCTSTNPQDSHLYKFALNHQIEFFPGSENDVLSRLEDAAKYYDYDAFVSITADNPLHSINIAETLIKKFKNENYDFIFTKGLPIGIAPYFIRTDALSIANFMKKDTDTEIWGPFVNRPDFFNIGILQVTNSIFNEDKRITCDTKKDYELFKLLFQLFKNKYPDITEIFNILNANPQIWNLNKNITQKAVPKKVLKKIDTNFSNMVDKGKRFAKKKGIILNAGLQIIKISI